MSRDFRLRQVPVDVLSYELAEEKASALGRMGRALEKALATLREFDTIHPRSETSRPERRALVAEAGHALWMLMVQREACGLRDTRMMMRDYGVPGEVQMCMGIAPPPSKRST